ncbi:hypothetical protein [Streptomyces sp. NPDC091371]|uniref:hypothetical protein n=1 Tax=Streptomyces sp. NPDC091371 TaxID=3155303 RepID=UPI0034478CE2
MTSRAQRAAPWPRPLPLLAALLLGRPTESHASEDAPAVHTVAPAAPLPGTGTGTGTGTDPWSLCLAVLTGLVVLPPGAGPAGSRGTAPLGGAGRIPGRSGGGPAPPAPRALPHRPGVLHV